MRLAHLLTELKLPIQIDLGAAAELEIGGVCEDSRQVRAGDLFVARAGKTTSGAGFVADAKSRGAVAVVSEESLEGSGLPVVVMAGAGRRLSEMAHLVWGKPSQGMRVLGVTGTNGKTTCVYLMRHLLTNVGKKCGMIGTVETDDGKTRDESVLTTPGAADIGRLMGAMRDNGCAACAMEVSSQGLDQGRVAAVRFAGAAFTNLTGDHLDYHQTMENYAAAKAGLFTMLDETGVAVVNGDDHWAARMVRDCAGRVVRWGFGESADWRARDVGITQQGCRFILHGPDGRAEVGMGLIGKHNVQNALASAALVGEVFGLSVHQIAAGLRDAPAAPGRLQAVRCGQPFTVLVDYAHTDDALENVLSTLRGLARGRLRVLFGCGGDRDRTKRPRMARVAAKFADVIYVTSDNPRTEDPAAIIDEICNGLETGRNNVVIEADRRAAIALALQDADAGDIVLLAGKGHENYQIVGTTKHHFDDVEEAEQVLAKLATAGAGQP